MSIAKLGLGSVQLGVDYGATHRGGRPDRGACEKILERAAAAGLRLVDTAPSYGEAESRLGALRPASWQPRFVSKTAHAANDPRPLLESVTASCERLGVGRLYGLLDHIPDALRGTDGARRIGELSALRERGLVEKVGLSVYRAEQIDAVSVGDFPQLVQVPVSVLDQRLLKSGDLERLRGLGVEVHARSLLLQGLLVVEPEGVPERLAALREPIGHFRRVAREHDLEPLEAALGFVLASPDVDVAVCGVQSVDQLEALIAAAATPVDPDWFRELAVDDPALVDPSRW